MVFNSQDASNRCITHLTVDVQHPRIQNQFRANTVDGVSEIVKIAPGPLYNRTTLIKQKWFLYMLECVDHSLYTGVTPDIARRLKTHATGKGSRYVRSRLPFKLVYQEKHPNKSKALRREAQIKSWPREKKLRWIRVLIPPQG